MIPVMHLKIPTLNVYIKMDYNLWSVLGVACVFLLILFRKGKNAVWGGLTFGVVIGSIFFLVSRLFGGIFSWIIILKFGIVSTFVGCIFEIIGIVSLKLSRRN